ncbi:ion channel [Lithospermum erythrorhizon]|uniref:Ion channel n=1 Tax=Lithospermum erythrorhizon TaxID=34254 RepID=A0AAV3PM94_LITER
MCKFTSMVTVFCIFLTHDLFWFKGSRLRVAFCFLLPAVQLVVGISYPSWLLLPFFICSCIGLVDRSLTSNFLGLFRWWKLLWIYAGFVVCLLYVFQLPIEFPTIINKISDFIGLYRLSPNPDWQEISSGVSLLVFYYMVCISSDLWEYLFNLVLQSEWDKYDPKGGKDAEVVRYRGLQHVSL